MKYKGINKDTYIKVRSTISYKNKLKEYCKINNIPDVSKLVILALDEYMSKNKEIKNG